MDDLERAKSLGMTLDEFQQLIGDDPLAKHSEFLQASEEEGEKGEVIPTLKNVAPQLSEMEMKLKLKRKL